jgi:hypothetical protein
MPKSKLVQKVLDSEQSKNFSEFIDYFMTDILPTKNLAKKTVQD